MEKFIMSQMKNFASATVSLEVAVSESRTEENLRALMEHEEAFLLFLENVRKSGEEGFQKADAINMVYQAVLRSCRSEGSLEARAVPTFFCTKDRYPEFLPEALKTAGIEKFRYIEEPSPRILKKFLEKGFSFPREAVLLSGTILEEEPFTEELEAEDSLIEEDLEALN